MLSGVKCGLGRSRTEELDHVDEFCVVCESLHKLTSGQLPNYDLSVVSRANYIFVTIADNDISYVVEVRMQ